MKQSERERSVFRQTAHSSSLLKPLTYKLMSYKIKSSAIRLVLRGKKGLDPAAYPSTES